MPFRAQRSHLAALILPAILAGLALLSGGCALRGPAAPAAAPGGEVATGPSLPWQVIDGGLAGGNPVTGPVDIRFIRPVAVAARGPLIYIVDAGHERLFRYDTTTERLTVVKDLRDIVSGEVSDIYLMPDLSFYLADADGGRVLHFDRDGNLVRTFEDRINIGRPVTVYVNDDTGYVFIADGFNDDVMVFNPAGLLEGAIGIRGLGPGRFLGLMAMAQGPKGYYVATRFGEQRVQVMGFDGRYLESFQKDTVTFPTAIAVSGDNLAFVSDYLADDIKVFDDGVLVGTLGGHGSAPGRFRRITDLWLDDGFLYVADSLNGRIQVLPLAAVDVFRHTRP